MTLRVCFAALGLSAVLAGCASPATGPEFQLAPTPPDRGAVYIYRPGREFNHGGYPYVFLNGEKKFSLREKGYALLPLVPGNYEIKVEGSQSGTNWWPPPATRTLAVEAGQEYFVRVVPTLPPGTKPGPHLFTNNISRTEIELVPKEQAVREATGLREVSD
jgi:hypothetical protein